ncbi:hypothetical protein ACFS5J_10660 [Flavobacterium chuncheonense]|uniref:Uncharacterized protein n=1 Tax=Flavobacterium chuncheonense TaxID=2026653 RepID=A0ABW5YN33_9FLAO
MKSNKFLSVLLLFGVLVFSNGVFAQKGKSAGKQIDNVEKEIKKIDKDVNDHHDKADKKHDDFKHEMKKNDNEGKGNAYGKDKGNLSGKEFGQRRAEESREKLKGKMKELDDNELRLRDLRKQLDKERKRGDLDNEGLERILRAERKIDEAEYKVRRAKSLLRDTDDELKKILDIR